ncbi:porin [Variovorax terrae]|uniref:Porin n=1 Tax=Variovorax terrae TaxID=2923278 RepID=A0A9X2AP56_9BURK|nr:porin [Variovorax terrae]MCJ0761691.1 porin [Variovorax terrae]
MSDYRRLSGLAAGILLACGGAAAQSSVTVYGVIDTYMGKKQLASASGAHTTNVDGGGLTTSYWGFRGSEDLGGGSSAIFDISGSFRPDSGDFGRYTGDTVFSRSSWVGLQGGWGSVRLGRMSSPNFLLAIRLSPYAESTSLGPYLLHTYVGGQPLEAAVASGGPAAVSDSGYSNAATYASPKLNGFQGTLAYSLGEVANSSNANRRISYSLTYENGPLFAGLGGERVHAPTMPAPPAVPAANQKSQQNTDQFGLSYDFGAAKAFVSHSRTDIDLPAPRNRRFRTSQIGTSIPVGTGFILLSGARTTRSETAVADVKRSTYSLGYDHFLSKRTDLYVVAMRDQVTNLQSGTTFVAGVRHRF